MIINKIINKTNFFYTDEYESTNLGEYYNHILSILEKNFVDEEVPYEVNFGISDLKKKLI